MFIDDLPKLVVSIKGGCDSFGDSFGSKSSTRRAKESFGRYTPFFRSSLGGLVFQKRTPHLPHTSRYLYKKQNGVWEVSLDLI